MTPRCPTSASQNRKAWWKDVEVLMLRHQLAVARRERPGARARLTWPDRSLLALLAGTLPIDRLAPMRAGQGIRGLRAA